MAEAPTTVINDQAPALVPEPASNGRLIVEIGPGRNPFPASGTSKLNAGDRYLGIDSESAPFGFESHFDTARQSLGKSLGSMGVPFELRDGDGAQTGLSDSSVDEVYVGNVFCLTLFSGSTDDNQAFEMLRELSRIIKPGGKVTIVENRVPANRERLVRLAQEVGLVQQNSGHERDEDTITAFDSKGLSGMHDSYVLVYSKPEPAR